MGSIRARGLLGQLASLGPPPALRTRLPDPRPDEAEVDESDSESETYDDINIGRTVDIDDTESEDGRLNDFDVC